MLSRIGDTFILAGGLHLEIKTPCRCHVSGLRVMRGLVSCTLGGRWCLESRADTSGGGSVTPPTYFIVANIS